MKFGIHNSSWLDRPDPAEAFKAVKAKAQWAEDHGFVWFSVMDHMMFVGTPAGRAGTNEHGEWSLNEGTNRGWGGRRG
jgi:hypothetical protein